MCGRFVNLNKVSYLNKVFNFTVNKSIKNKLSFNIAPSQWTNIITNTKEFKLEYAKWGISFLDNKTNLMKNVINSRLESINEKNLFKESFEKRKCVIPANGYYEWVIKEKIKMPYFIHVPEREPLFFAGIWKFINFKESLHKLFSIITKPANNLTNKIHHRMPVVLSINEALNFLDTKNSNFLNINFSSNMEEYLEFYKVSKFVNNPSNNSIDCIREVN